MLHLEGALMLVLVEQTPLCNLNFLFLFLLPLNVFPDLFLIQSNRTHTISPAPHMPPPVSDGSE
jgi:hypothetical protein